MHNSQLFERSSHQYVISMITTIIQNSEFTMHNYDYYYTLCLLLQVTCSLVNSFTYELMNYH